MVMSSICPNALAIFQRGDGRGADEPFGAEDDRCSMGRVHVGCHFGRDLDDAGRNAEMRHAARLGKTQSSDPLIGKQDSDSTEQALTQAKVSGGKVDRHTFRTGNVGRGLLGGGAVAATDQ